MLEYWRFPFSPTEADIMANGGHPKPQPKPDDKKPSGEAKPKTDASTKR